MADISDLPISMELCGKSSPRLESRGGFLPLSTRWKTWATRHTMRCTLALRINAWNPRLDLQSPRNLRLTLRMEKSSETFWRPPDVDRERVQCIGVSETARVFIGAGFAARCRVPTLLPNVPAPRSQHRCRSC